MRFPLPVKATFKAKVFHWLHAASGDASGILESEKAPLENRVWYSYYGQASTVIEGTNGRPKQIARVLDDGTGQITTFEYNWLGKVTKLTDPTNRQTLFVYDTNLIDLLQVRQAVGSTNELVSSRCRAASADGDF
ncbi:MAG: hypothetical protein L0Y58_07480 [Verrucomicrobia subdivision 3 bacterium]|nr:hypothetical protein [Limisphaerales bacterium]